MIRTVAPVDAAAVKGVFLDLLALVAGMDRDQQAKAVSFVELTGNQQSPARLPTRLPWIATAWTRLLRYSATGALDSCA